MFASEAGPYTVRRRLAQQTARIYHDQGGGGRSNLNGDEDVSAGLVQFVATASSGETADLPCTPESCWIGAPRRAVSCKSPPLLVCWNGTAMTFASRQYLTLCRIKAISHCLKLL